MRDTTSEQADADPLRTLGPRAWRGTDFDVVIVGEDGDRDGIPNVLLEAMACWLPVGGHDRLGNPGTGLGRSDRTTRSA